jgi:hypothetical protein
MRSGPRSRRRTRRLRRRRRRRPAPTAPAAAALASTTTRRRSRPATAARAATGARARSAAATTAPRASSCRAPRCTRCPTSRARSRRCAVCASRLQRRRACRHWAGKPQRSRTCVCVERLCLLSQKLLQVNPPRHGRQPNGGDAGAGADGPAGARRAVHPPGGHLPPPPARHLPRPRGRRRARPRVRRRRLAAAALHDHQGAHHDERHDARCGDDGRRALLGRAGVPRVRPGARAAQGGPPALHAGATPRCGHGAVPLYPCLQTPTIRRALC